MRRWPLRTSKLPSCIFQSPHPKIRMRLLIPLAAALPRLISIPAPENPDATLWPKSTPLSGDYFNPRTRKSGCDTLFSVISKLDTKFQSPHPKIRMRLKSVHCDHDPVAFQSPHPKIRMRPFPLSPYITQSHISIPAPENPDATQYSHHQRLSLSISIPAPENPDATSFYLHLAI